MRAFSEGCSFQLSCTIFRTRCFSAFTWLHCNKAIASLRQNCKLSVWVFSMTSRNSSDISTSSLLRLQRMILLRASVAICSGRTTFGSCALWIAFCLADGTEKRVSPPSVSPRSRYRQIATMKSSSPNIGSRPRQ